MLAHETLLELGETHLDDRNDLDTEIRERSLCPLLEQMEMAADMHQLNQHGLSQLGYTEFQKSVSSPENVPDSAP